MMRFLNSSRSSHSILRHSPRCVLVAMTAARVHAAGGTADARSAKLDRAVSAAVDFLEQAQADDGSFSAASGPGITAIVATALLRIRPHGERSGRRQVR